MLSQTITGTEKYPPVVLYDKFFNSRSYECVSTKLGVTENFVSSLYLLIQSSTLKKCIEHCLTALATLLHVILVLIKFSLI